jgi:hypothetical protein
LSRQRYAASVIDEATGERIVIGRFREKWQADRASIVKALQPGFTHAQTHDTQENDDGQ